MPRMLKPRSLERNSRNIKGCHERLRVNRDDLAKEIEKDNHDRMKAVGVKTSGSRVGGPELCV